MLRYCGPLEKMCMFCFINLCLSANESFVPLSRPPPRCGYSVQTTWRDLRLMAQYDACHVTRKVWSLWYVLFIGSLFTADADKRAVCLFSASVLFKECETLARLVIHLHLALWSNYSCRDSEDSWGFSQVVFSKTFVSWVWNRHKNVCYECVCSMVAMSCLCCGGKLQLRCPAQCLISSLSPMVLSPFAAPHEVWVWKYGEHLLQSLWG